MSRIFSRSRKHHITGVCHAPVSFENAPTLRHNHADRIAALRNFNPRKLLDREAIAEVVRHAAQVVGAVRERDVLGVRALLGELLHRTVQITHHHFGFEHLFAVDRRLDAKNTMG
jgi:hypothetical protein